MFRFGLFVDTYTDRILKPYRVHIAVAIIVITIMVIGIYYLIDRRTILREADSTGWINVTVKFDLYSLEFRHYIVTFQNVKGNWVRKQCIVNPFGIDWRD